MKYSQGKDDSSSLLEAESEVDDKFSLGEIKSNSGSHKFYKAFSKRIVEMTGTPQMLSKRQSLIAEVVHLKKRAPIQHDS